MEKDNLVSLMNDLGCCDRLAKTLHGSNLEAIKKVRDDIESRIEALRDCEEMDQADDSVLPELDIE
jgi:hypothetical protein